MFDKTFFKFAVGFVVIIVGSLSLLYIGGYFWSPSSVTVTATASTQ